MDNGTFKISEVNPLKSYRENAGGCPYYTVRPCCRAFVVRSFMANKNDVEASKLYLSIMEEVKIRAYSMNTARNIPNGLPPPLIREYCFLQLRMLCELIALGCLVAHGDIQESKAKDFQKAYKADDILKRLEALHPDFYPVPVKPTFGNNSVDLEAITSGFLTKPELITLYGKCGDVLHKGNLRRLLSPRMPSQTNFPDIDVWGQKMLNLLSAHRLIRRGSRFGFLTFLEVTQNGGNVQVGFFESPQPSAST